MNFINYYELYKNNLKKILTAYNFKYYWLDIASETFYNSIYRACDDFTHTDNQYLLKYQNYKVGLAEDILKNGMFTPIFYMVDDKGRKQIYLGKHRLYSLILYSQNKRINKKLLFIECPYSILGQYNYKIPDDVKQTNVLKLFGSTGQRDLEIKDFYPDTLADINDVLLYTGDALSPWLYDNNITPDKIFNDENAFEEFLNK